jgi:hypothetical protein
MDGTSTTARPVQAPIQVENREIREFREARTGDQRDRGGQNREIREIREIGNVQIWFLCARAL